jgi:hypothetical protein
MVEHGMRVMHLTGLDMCRWHFSTNGAHKGWRADWLEVSDDGCVAFDAARLDGLVEQCDTAAKPFKLDYLVYLQAITDGADAAHKRFKAAFPDRFKDKPPGLEAASQSYYVQEMLTLFRRHLERRDWLQRVVVKIADEPPGLNWWWERTVAAQEAGVPFMTAFNNIDWKDAETGLGTALRVWQPLYMLYDEAFFKKARASGAKISWYNCGPPPKTSVGASASELRGYLWQAAKADLDVVSWWGIQCWSYNDVWEDRYSHWNSVVYPLNPQQPAWQKPGKSWVDTAPIDSLRWEHIRDGMEDAWYVNLLRSEIADARAKGMEVAARQSEAVMDTIWRETFPTLNDYAPDYQRMLECRTRIAQAIVDLRRQLRSRD